jgi:hypothetical protein
VLVCVLRQGDATEATKTTLRRRLPTLDSSFFFYSGSCRSHIHASRVLLLFVDVGVVSSIPYEIATPVSCFLAVVLEAAQLCLSFFLNSFSFRKGDRFDTPSLTPLTPFSIHHSSVSPRPHHYYHYCTFSHKSPIILI